MSSTVATKTIIITRNSIPPDRLVGMINLSLIKVAPRIPNVSLAITEAQFPQKIPAIKPIAYTKKRFNFAILPLCIIIMLVNLSTLKNTADEDTKVKIRTDENLSYK